MYLQIPALFRGIAHSVNPASELVSRYPLSASYLVLISSVVLWLLILLKVTKNRVLHFVFHEVDSMLLWKLPQENGIV